MHIIDREYLNVTTPSCHAGTIAFFKNKPICAWFGGSQEGNPDVAIYVQCGDKIYVMGDKDQIPRWNPILFPFEDRLFLFVKLGRFCDCWSTLIFDISNIFDEKFDINKCKYQVLPAGLNGPTKTKPIVNDNLIYCGSSVETIIDWSSYCEIYGFRNGVFEFKERSLPMTVPKKIYEDPYYGAKRMTMGVIQPSLWVDKNDDMHAFFRSSRGLGKIYHSFTTLAEKTNIWSPLEETNFSNPNSGLDAVYVNDRLFLVHNPSDTNRYPLIISELDENFKSIDSLAIEYGVKGNANSPELSYPYLIENEGKLYLVYTYGRSKIEMVMIGI